MTDAYARDAMGGGGGLSDAARARLTLEVREDNARALGLYQEQGYVHAGLGGASYRLMMKPL